MLKELGEKISWINGSTDVEKPDYIIGDGLMDMMVSQCIVAFIYRRVGNGATSDITLVTPKHLGFPIERDSHLIRRVYRRSILFFVVV
jgi:hypothetical protein